MSQDQRMNRICSSLVRNNYEVLLVGRLTNNSLTLQDSIYETHRLRCILISGFLFYLEFNIRLFFFLLKQKTDIINSVDLDTLAPGRLASWIKNKHFTFDAHELFTEVPELNGRPFRKLIWKIIESLFTKGKVTCYTVNESLAIELQKRTNRKYKVIQNYPVARDLKNRRVLANPIELVYQGMLNKGRGLEELIAAVGSKNNLRLHIIGRGDLETSINELVEEHQNIKVHGFIKAETLADLTSQFHIGFNLLSGDSTNYYLSSANKFFDYIMAGVPVVCMNFPEYRKVNEGYKVAELIDDLTESSILSAIEKITNDYQSYSINCRNASAIYNWETQEKNLLSLYDLVSSNETR